MIEDLSEEDFLLILTAAEEIDGVVIGGQALNLWADALLREEEYDESGPFTSKDIDFWGKQAAADELSRRLNGKVHLPDAWSTNQPSEAAVIVTLGGKRHQIDFLHKVCGLNTKKFLRRAQEIEINGVTVALLHPIDVLKSREAGVRILRRTDRGAIRQLRAAPIIALRFIEELLDHGRISEAQDAIKEMIQIGVAREIDDLYTHYDYDPLTRAASLADRPEWHAKFAEFQIRQACERGSAARTRRIAEATRRINRSGGNI